MMRDIIEELCEGCYEPRFQPSREYIQRRKEDDPLWNQVAETFGLEFVDRLWSGANASSSEQGRNMFRHGFHLGALLMLDLLYEPPRPV